MRLRCLPGNYCRVNGAYTLFLEERFGECTRTYVKIQIFEANYEKKVKIVVGGGQPKISYTVFRARRITFFLANRVENGFQLGLRQ